VLQLDHGPFASVFQVKRHKHLYQTLQGSLIKVQNHIDHRLLNLLYYFKHMARLKSLALLEKFLHFACKLLKMEAKALVKDAFC
jgi:hypothetical protein